MHEAVLKDVLGDHRSAIRLGGQGHVLRLHIGGEAGIFFSIDVGGQQTAVPDHADAVVRDLKVRSRFAELLQQCAEVAGLAVGHDEIAAGHGAGNDECARRNAVGDDAVSRSCQPRHTLNADGGRPHPLDPGAHLDKQRCQVAYLRFAGTIFHHGFALGQHGCHHQLLGAGHSDAVPDDVASAQALGASFDVAVVLGDAGAQMLKTLDVQVDGTGPDGASAGQGDTRAARARHQRSQHQRRGPHGLHQFVGGFGADRLATVDGGAVMRAAVTQFNFGPHLHQQLAHGLDVAHLGDVLQHDGLVGEQSRRHRGKRSVLGAADAHRPDQWIAAADYKFVHGTIPLVVRFSIVSRLAVDGH